MSDFYDETTNPFGTDNKPEEKSQENEPTLDLTDEIKDEHNSHFSFGEQESSQPDYTQQNFSHQDTPYQSGQSFAANNMPGDNFAGRQDSQQFTPPYQQSQNDNQQYGSQQYNPQQNYSQQYNGSQYSQYNPYNPQPEPKKTGKGKKVLFGILIAIAILASLGIGMSIGTGSKPSTNNTDSSSSDETTAQSVSVQVETTKSSNEQLAAVDVAEKVRPSVVGVMAYLNGQLSGEGSGVIFCEDNTKTYTYIMTCAHVISDDGLEFSVLTLDGKPYDAKLIGYDERTDIGVLRIEASGLPVAAIGDSSSLRIGENVYAIGNPGGSEYFGSMTSGIVSAIDRSISSTYTMKVIQHDAAINPGNSGGALVNTSGQVIGINSSKIADTEFEGMGFAIPMATAKNVAESLITYGYVPNRPMLGIQYADVSDYQFYSMLVGIKELPQGSLIISSIATNSDLADKDVKSGDLIIAVNGTNMDTSDILLDLIEKSSVGDKITLTICRIDTKSYKTTTFDVTVKLVEEKGTVTYKDKQEETTTEAYGGYPFGGSDYYEDFFRQFFGY